MKNIKLKVKVINELNEEVITDTVGQYDENNNLITYYDKNILVTILLGNTIIMHREHPNYVLELIFNASEASTSKYEIYNPKSEFTLNVETEIIERKERGFFVKYRLKINEEDMGLFTIFLDWEE